MSSSEQSDDNSSQDNQSIDSKTAVENWTDFEMNEALAESLVANKFEKPTEVQQKSLIYLQQHIDMVIAAKTGQGKTLCFGLPILDMLIKKVDKWRSNFYSSDEEEESEGKDKKKRKMILDAPKALIISPTRELAIQIKDMIQTVIPIDYVDDIKTCCLVGGMSIQKQQRLLSYCPAIIIATPGRLWELMDDIGDPYLLKGLPMIDVLVLDEADRMIADGHFKELHKILDYIYHKRVLFKNQILEENKKKRESKQEENSAESEDEIDEDQEIVKKMKEAVTFDSKEFIVGKNLQKAKESISIKGAKIVDLNQQDEEELENENLVIDLADEKKAGAKVSEKKNKKQLTREEKAFQEAEEEQFNKDYMRMGGIQHIICSATLTINSQGRVTPRQLKMQKKRQQNKKKGKKVTPDQEQVDTLDKLCNLLKFRSKTPKVIDLTEDVSIILQGGKPGALMMPQSLTEMAFRCKSEEKDLYLYYYLQEKKGQSVIVFCNAITTVRRLTSLLDFLQVKNWPLHSKMQQRQRIKNLDRFKKAVNQIEASNKDSEDKSVFNETAILVCTDVAARGLDIPCIGNVLHYQCPYNAEIYVHRAGRTARIGRSGTSTALLAPEDSKQFKVICQVLKKSEEQIQHFEVKYQALDRMRQLIDQANKLEKQVHHSKKNEKSANWMIKAAEKAELAIDDDLQYELQEKLGSKKSQKLREAGIITDTTYRDFAHDDSIQRKRESKEQQKQAAMKQKYQREIENQKLRKFSHSQFLTPEAANYLNQAINEKAKKVDEEVIYAGLHQENKNKTKFKRTKKYTSRYTKSRGQKRRRKGKFG